jgi:hypothetical protein
MSSCPINYSTAVEIIARFYQRALETEDAAGALTDIQRAALTETCDQDGLIAAVRRGSAFILSFESRRRAAARPPFAMHRQ